MGANGMKDRKIQQLRTVLKCTEIGDTHALARLNHGRHPDHAALLGPGNDEVCLNTHHKSIHR